MGKIVKDRIIYGGIDSALQNKVGSAPLDTTAQNLSDAVNEIVAGGVSDTWRNIKINGTEQLGTATSSGAVDFVNGSNTTVSFNSTGNTISITADDEIIEITATDYDALSYAEKHNGKYYHITDRNSSNELDTKVTQTQDDSTNAAYEVLLAGSTSATTATESAKKSSGLTYNPSTSVLSMSGTPSGNTDVVTKAYADGKVDKTGDIMTGDLIIENTSNASYLISKSDNVTLNTSANNNVTAQQVRGVRCYDSNDARFGVFQAIANTDGSVQLRTSARNMLTNGSFAENYIDLTMKKDGTREYAVADKAAFRTAIGLGSTLLKSITVATVTTYSISSNWTDFKYLLLNIWYNEYLCASTTIPTSNISNGDYMIACLNDGTIRKAQIKLVDNTHISIPSSSSFSNITKAELIGII